MKVKLFALAIALISSTVLAINDQTYVDDIRGFSIAHPSTWPSSVRGESLCFESPEGPTVSMRIQPMPAEDNQYNSIYEIQDGEEELLRGISELPGASIVANGRTTLSGRDAYWIKHRMVFNSLGGTAYAYTYQVVALTSKGLLYCTYMAAGASDQEAQAVYTRVWDAALSMMRTLFIHP